MRTKPLKLTLSLFLAASFFLIALPSASADTACQSGAKIAADVWKKYDDEAKKIGCVGAAGVSLVASGGASLPATVEVYKACMGTVNTADKITREIIKAWNTIVKNSALKIGPRFLEMNNNYTGIIRSTAGRLYVTDPLNATTLDLEIEKKRFRGKTGVTVCKFPAPGPKGTKRNGTEIWSFTMGPGLNNKGKTWQKDLGNVEGHVVTVHLDGKSAVKSMKYRLRAEKKNILEAKKSLASQPDRVVIAGPPGHHGGNPGVVRLRNVGSDNFEIRFQEYEYREQDLGDTSHRIERIPYLVLEPGRHEMPDGSIWEVGAFALDGTKSWRKQSFDSNFSERPHLFLTMQTHNGHQAATVRARNVDKNGFDAAIFEEEALNDGHNREVVGYLAIHSKDDSGHAIINGFKTDYVLANEKIDHGGAEIRGRKFFLEEEKSKDDETRHVDERVDVLEINGIHLAQIVTANGGDTVALRTKASGDYNETALKTGRAVADLNWQSVPLQFEPDASEKPVVIAGPPSYRGGNPGVVRLRNVSRTGFDVRFQEYEYREKEHDDTSHLNERIPYIVLEPGRHKLQDGSIWEVGTFKLDGTKKWDEQSFQSKFDHPPKLFLTMQTHNGHQAATVRAKDVTETGFKAAIFEEEALNDGHNQEVVGYLAVRNWKRVGPLDVNGFGTGYHVESAKLDTSGKTVKFGAGKYNPEVELYLQEEKSKDQETGHVTEKVDAIKVGRVVVAQIVTANGGDTVALRIKGDGDFKEGALKAGRASTALNWRVVPIP